MVVTWWIVGFFLRCASTCCAGGLHVRLTQFSFITQSLHLHDFGVLH